ncbi:NAC domain containing protein [Trema orientale]|uniref:NAC domain containing protein n=1 Tax=Trema orientale TaxID=63057 RepID=A0A2P5FHE9_TREOI|nr:NAC domain containing protein [Trema orientale]
MSSSNAVMLSSDTMPKWFRFHLTDEEIITHLMLKGEGMDSQLDPYIPEVDTATGTLHNYLLKLDNKEWLFLYRPDYKYSNSNRSKRKTKTGFWKKTGKERETKDCVGRKRHLVFHKGSTPGKGTGWVIHEYYYPQPHIDFRHQKPACVICRLKYNARKKGRKADTPDSNVSSEASALTQEVQCYDILSPQSISQPSLVFFSIEETRRFLLNDETQAPF